MNPALYGALRTIVQGAIAWAFARFAILGVLFGDASIAVEWIMAVVVLGGYTYAAIWLANRTGEDFWPRAARLVAKIMMLGVVKTPSYPAVVPQQRQEPEPYDRILDS